MTNLSLAPLQSANVVASPTGLQFHPDISYAEWADIFAYLFHLEEWVQFALGDTYNAGIHLFKEDCYQAIPENYSPRTLENFAYVARQVPISRRRENVSFSHHYEVAKLSARDQVAALTMARSRDNPTGLSVRALRAFIADNGATDANDKRYCPTCHQRLP